MKLACRRADLLAVLTLLVFDLLAYGRLLDPSVMLADYDAYVYFYPLRAFAAFAVQQGQLPLWNPHSFLGAPFIANPQTAFFYPPTWLFFWLSVPWVYGLHVFGHILLAGLAMYAFLRISGALRPPAALVGGLTFMLSGVLSGQYGHLNQLSAVAWLPLILLAADQAVARQSVRLAVAAAVALSLQLLAGHPQQSFMTLLAMGLVCLWRALPLDRLGLARLIGLLGIVAMFGTLLAAVQLVPTAELARASIRGAGLGYRDAVADSLWPWLVARALLPSFVNDLGSTEFLGYVGILPLLLAAIALGAAGARPLAPGLVLATLGLILALGGANPIYPLLYDWVPGFSSFRVPARWLLLYTVGTVWLAATGLDWLLSRPGPSLTGRQWRRLLGTLMVLALAAGGGYLAGTRTTRSLQMVWLGLLLLGLLLALGCSSPRTRWIALPAIVLGSGFELWLAGGDLAPRYPVPIEAYAQPRDSTLFVQSKLLGGRFLSIASEEYELKETPDYREWYSGWPEQALTRFLIAAKRNEVLTPNLNLLYRIDDVDGYDGGLLPLQRYLGLAGLLVPDGRIRPDGVLISRMESLPPRPLMDLLNLRVVLAGRSKDGEDDGVTYDRSVLVELRPGERLELGRVPAREYTAVGLISSVVGAESSVGQEIGRLELAGASGERATVPLVAGRDTAAERASGEPAAPLELQRPWAWRQPGDPVEYLGKVAIPPLQLRSLSVVNTSLSKVLKVRAITLLDERDGAFTSLVLDDRLERTRFFDMKVYEYPEVLPRAYLVHQALEADDADGLAVLADPAHRPGEQAIVEPGAGLTFAASDGNGDVATITAADINGVEVRTQSARPALLILSDAYYPGWSVTIDGAPARLLRANVALRGVEVPAGDHSVVFTFEPDSFRLGLLLSLFGLGLAAAVLVAPSLVRRLSAARGSADGPGSRS